MNMNINILANCYPIWIWGPVYSFSKSSYLTCLVFGISFFLSVLLFGLSSYLYITSLKLNPLSYQILNFIQIISIDLTPSELQISNMRARHIYGPTITYQFSDSSLLLKKIKIIPVLIVNWINKYLKTRMFSIPMFNFLLFLAIYIKIMLDTIFIPEIVIGAAN